LSSVEIWFDLETSGNFGVEVNLAHLGEERVVKIHEYLKSPKLKVVWGSVGVIS
jgi:phosphopantothenate synthetase